MNIQERLSSGGCHGGWWGSSAKNYARTQQLLKQRSGTDPIMNTHHEADQITGRRGTPTFEIKDCPLHAQLGLAYDVPMPYLVLRSVLILL